MKSENRQQRGGQRPERKLTVRRDTLRQLTDARLRRVAGGTWSHRGEAGI